MLLQKYARAENTIDSLKVQRTINAGPARARAGPSEAQTEEMMVAARRAIAERDDLQESEMGLRTQTQRLQQQVEELQARLQVDKGGNGRDGHSRGDAGSFGGVANGAAGPAVATRGQQEQMQPTAPPMPSEELLRQLEHTQHELAQLRAIVHSQRDQHQHHRQGDQRGHPASPPVAAVSQNQPPTPRSVHFDDRGPQMSYFHADRSVSPPRGPSFDGQAQSQQAQHRPASRDKPPALSTKDLEGSSMPAAARESSSYDSFHSSLHGNRWQEPELALQVADMRAVVADMRRALVALIYELNAEARQHRDGSRIGDHLFSLQSKADLRGTGSPDNLWQREQLGIQIERENLLRQRRQVSLEQHVTNYHRERTKFQEALLQLRTLEVRAGLQTLADQLGALPDLQLDVKATSEVGFNVSTASLPRRLLARGSADPSVTSVSVLNNHGQDDLPRGIMTVAGQTRPSSLLDENAPHDCALHAIPKGRPPLGPRRNRSEAKRPASLSSSIDFRVEELGASSTPLSPLEMTKEVNVSNRSLPATGLRQELHKLNESISKLTAQAEQESYNHHASSHRSVRAAAGYAADKSHVPVSRTPAIGSGRRARSLSPSDLTGRVKRLSVGAAKADTSIDDFATEHLPSIGYDSADYWRHKWAMEDAQRAMQSQRSLMDIALYETALQRAVRRAQDDREFYRARYISSSTKAYHEQRSRLWRDLPKRSFHNERLSSPPRQAESELLDLEATLQAAQRLKAKSKQLLGSLREELKEVDGDA